MAVHKLLLEEFDEIDYELIAIHTTIEDYHLAYLLNKNLPILLSRTKKDIQINSHEGIAHFPLYSFECPLHGSMWSLISNQGDIPSKGGGDDGLFSASEHGVATRVYLLPEFKKVNYFIKIENLSLPVSEIVKYIHSIDRITTVYTVETGKIKSINNLIF